MSEPASSAPVLEARGLCKAYAGVRRRIEVLRGLDLGVAAGEAIAVIGDSGVGKSTLLHLLGGLDRADAGTLRFAKLDLLSLSGAALAEYRNRSVGFVFQFHHLLPEFTALENVEMPFRIGRHKGGGTEQARATLARLGLAERLDHRPAALSGGEQQRVAIARALAPRPALVLADEPTGNLDPNSARAVFELLREVQGERGFAMVLATHSSRLAHACDRVLRLEEGVLRPLDEAETARYFEAT